MTHEADTATTEQPRPRRIWNSYCKRCFCEAPVSFESQLCDECEKPLTDE